MRHARIPALLALLFVIGCSGTPRQQWYTAAKLYNSTTWSLLTLHELGHITDEQLESLDPVVMTTDAALREARRHVDDEESFRVAMDIVDAALRGLATSVARSENAIQ